MADKPIEVTQEQFRIVRARLGIEADWTPPPIEPRLAAL